jgi:hypothetical protein
MSETDEARWAQLAEAATPGPWEMFRYRTGGGRIHISGDDGRKRSLIADMDGEPDAVATVYNEADREFLFAARDAVPALLAEVSRLRAEVAEKPSRILVTDEQTAMALRMHDVHRTVNPVTLVESVPAGSCVSLTVGGYWLGVPRVNVAGVLTAGACAQ